MGRGLGFGVGAKRVPWAGVSCDHGRATEQHARRASHTTPQGPSPMPPSHAAFRRPPSHRDPRACWPAPSLIPSLLVVPASAILPASASLPLTHHFWLSSNTEAVQPPPTHRSDSSAPVVMMQICCGAAVSCGSVHDSGVICGGQRCRRRKWVEAAPGAGSGLV